MLLFLPLNRIPFSALYLVFACSVVFLNGMYPIADVGLLMILLGLLGVIMPFLPKLLVFAKSGGGALIAAIAVFGFSIGLADLALATTPTTGGTGFEQVAFQVYDLLDNWVGTTIAISAMGMGLVGMAARFSPAIIAGSVGTAIAVVAGPDAVVALSGGMII